jgi:hypothetical protein
MEISIVKMIDNPLSIIVLSQQTGRNVTHNLKIMDLDNLLTRVRMMSRERTIRLNSGIAHI